MPSTAGVPPAFRVLTPGSLSAVISIDDEGVITAWSAEAELVFGWTAEAMLGRRLSETIIPPQYRAAHEAALRRLRESGAAPSGRVIEATALRADGSEFPVELSISPPWPAADGRRMFTAFLRDLSERQRLEQLHRMQFQVTRALIRSSTLEQAAPDVLAAIGGNIGWDAGILWVVDHDGGALRAQTVWARPGIDLAAFDAASRDTRFGPDSAGLPGEVWRSGAPLAVPDFGENPDFPRAPSAREAGLRGAIGFPVSGAQGVIGVVEFFSADVQPADPLLLATMSDLGSQLGQFVEHRLAEELLRRRLHELEVLQRAAHALSASLDLDVVLDAVARIAAEALEAPRATVLRLDGDVLVINGEYDERGTRARDMAWPVGDLPGAEEVLRGAFWTGSLTEVGPSLRSVTERTGVTAVAMAPVRSGTEPFGILALLSREPRMLGESEKRLLTGIASLASLAVGNAESFRLEREHGRRMQALDSAKSQFLNLASHELRSPLTVLRGYVSMIADGSLGDLPDGVARVVPVLSTKLAQMNSLIDEMLDAARLEDDRLELNVESVDLREVLHDCVRQVEPSLQRDQRILVDEGPPVWVEADGARLATVIQNLLDNAIKYSPGAGDVVCTVSVDGEGALLSVRDSGLGIAAEDMPRLFTRFGRIVTAQNSHILGTGLGLYLARELMRMQGGDITAASAPGEGSVFTVHMPLARARS